MEEHDSSGRDKNSTSANAKSCGGSDSYWWRQHIAALAANLVTLGTGMGVAWTASARAVLRGEQPGSPLRLSLEESSWMTALVPVGALLGALPAGLLADRIGRKRTLLLQALPEIVGWLLVLFAYDRVWMLYFGRVCIGITVGTNVVLISMYNEEISEARTRGTLGTYLELMASTGMFISYVLGSFMPYFWYSLASIIPATSFLLIFSWMPESPVFLVARGRSEDAHRSLLWLRGPNYDVKSELNALEASLKKQTSNPNEQHSSLRCYSRCSVDRMTLKTISIALGITFFTQANGKNIFLYYMTDIFRDAGSSLSAETASIVVGAVYIAATFLPALTVDRFGRKPLLGGAYCIMGLCQLSMSVYSHFESKGHDVDSWRWVPLAALILFMLAITSGPGPLSWFMVAEFVPVEHRGWGVPLAMAFGRAVVLVLIKEFPVMVVDLGPDVTYGIFCIMCFLAIVFSYFCIPETKGKTRDEIKQKVRGDTSEKKQVTELT